MLKSSLLNLNLVIYSAWHKEFLDARNSRDGEKNQSEKTFVKHYYTYKYRKIATQCENIC